MLDFQNHYFVIGLQYHTIIYCHMIHKKRFLSLIINIEKSCACFVETIIHYYLKNFGE